MVLYRINRTDLVLYRKNRIYRTWSIPELGVEEKRERQTESLLEPSPPKADWTKKPNKL